MHFIRSFFRSKVRGNERLLWLIPAVDFALLIAMVFVPMGQKVAALPGLPIQVQGAVNEYRQAVGNRVPDKLIDFPGKGDLLAYGTEAIPVLIPYLKDEAQAPAAVDLLASIGGGEARQALLSILDGTVSAPPRNLAAAIARLGNRDTAQQLVAKYQGGRGPWDEVIVHSLQGMGPEGQKWIDRLQLPQ